jgi:hypothetical protein
MPEPHRHTTTIISSTIRSITARFVGERHVSYVVVPIQNLNPDVLMTEPAEDWSRRDAADLLPPPEIWSILIPNDSGSGPRCSTKSKS